MATNVLTPVLSNLAANNRFTALFTESLSASTTVVSQYSSSQGFFAGVASTSSTSGFSVSSSQSIASDIESLEDVAGIVVVGDGRAIVDLTTPFGPIQTTYDLVALGTQYVNQFNAISGTLTLTQGVASGTIDLGDGGGYRPGQINFAALVSTYVSNVIADLAGTVPFTNGALQLDLPTPLGRVTGSVDFSGGRLVSDLSTPVGDLGLNIDFPDDLQYDVPLGNGLSGVLDLG
jgi:hypothetical protein